jgi:acyl-CoA thioester hydrolase
VTQVADFTHDVRVYYEDTDGAGIVYYANYLRYLERARTEWLRSLGFEHSSLRESHGLVFTVARVEIDYRSPARLDDRLSVGVRVARVRRASLLLEQRIDHHIDHHIDQRIDQRIERRGGAPVVQASVLVACVDAKRMKPRPIPEDVITELSREHRPVSA